jgi:hypothetical protein
MLIGKKGRRSCLGLMSGRTRRKRNVKGKAVLIINVIMIGGVVIKKEMIISMGKVFVIKEMGIKVGRLKGLIVGIMIWKVV